MFNKKALAGILLSLGLAGGIVAPASVAFATDEVAPAPVVVNEAGTEQPIVVRVEIVVYGQGYYGYQEYTIEPGGSIVVEAVNIEGATPEVKKLVITYEMAKMQTHYYIVYHIVTTTTEKPTTVEPTTTEKPKTTEAPKTTTTETPKTTEEPKVEEPKVQAPAPVYRLYQPDLKVHLYTKDTNEYKVLATRGWKQEGISWRTETKKGEPVYRLYHPVIKVHLYTRDANENRVLATRGWQQEGVAYRSFGSVPVYRLYHPGIRKHLYTKDANEYKVLATRGWLQEGVAWYSQP